MKRSRFSEVQIFAIRKEQEAGVPVSEFCRNHGVSDASIYKWKAKYGGMDVSEAKRLKALEDENSKLKRMVAEHNEQGVKFGRRFPASGFQNCTPKHTPKSART
jgi:putative transposase